VDSSAATWVCPAIADAVPVASPSGVVVGVRVGVRVRVAVGVRVTVAVDVGVRVTDAVQVARGVRVAVSVSAVAAGVADRLALQEPPLSLLIVRSGQIVFDIVAPVNDDDDAFTAPANVTSASDVPVRLVDCRFAPVKSLRVRIDPAKLDPDRFALANVVSVRSSPDRFILCRVAPVKFAPSSRATPANALASTVAFTPLPWL